MDLSHEAIMLQLGNLHFLTLHFPVVLIFLLPVLLAVAPFSFGKQWAGIIPYLIYAGTIFAIPTAFFGLSMFWLKGGGAQLVWHRNFALAATFFMVILSLFVFFKKPNFTQKQPFYFYLIVFLTFISMVLAAHLGGESVHGTLFNIFQSGQ